MRILAPYPHTTTVIRLPDPRLSNTEAVNDERDYRIAMDKSVYSYIKRRTSKTFVYNFTLTIEKGLELLEFIKLFADDVWSWTDHNNVVHEGRCLTNPQEITVKSGPHLTCGLLGYSPNETVDFELVLESL